MAGAVARPAPSDVAAARPDPTATHRKLPQRPWYVWLAAITLLGAVLRLAWLDSVPPGLFFDVAANLFDVVDVLNGAHPIWFVRNNGREPLMLYATALAALAYGPTPFAAKITSAVFGIATVPATFWLGREAAARLGDRSARAIGLLAAFITATMYWHVHFSRLGLRTITLPLSLALGMALLLRAFRLASVRSAIGAGLAMGIATYTYTSVRLAPLAILPVLIGALAANRGRRGGWLAITFLALWLGVSAPLGVYYLRHPDAVQGRTAAVSVLNAEVGGADPLRAALRGVRATALALVWRGSNSGLENLPGRPLFEPVTATAFVLGSGLALVALVRRRPIGATAALLLLAMLGAMALSTILSVNPPGFVRISGMVPSMVVLAAIGGWAAAAAARPRLGAVWPVAIAIALAMPLGWTSYDYFGRWYGGGLAYTWVMEDKVQGAQAVSAWLGGGERVFLAPLYARDYTYSFLLRDRPPESFDLGAALVVPSEGRARYVFPPDDRDGLAAVAEQLGRPAQIEVLADRSGERPLLASLAVDGPPPPVGPPLATFERGIELLDARVSPTVARPGDTARLDLTWRATVPPDADYSVFVHGRLADATAFQRDRMPGAGSLPTRSWRPGDRIGDHYRLDLPREPTTGEYRIVVGLYRVDGGQRLRLIDRPGQPNELEVGRIRVAP